MATTTRSGQRKAPAASAAASGKAGPRRRDCCSSRCLGFTAIVVAVLAALALRFLASTDRPWMPPSCSTVGMGCPKPAYQAGAASDPRLAPLKDMLGQIVESGLFKAGRVAVVHKGKVVADFVASTAAGCLRPDGETYEPFTEDDYTMVFSSGKMMEVLPIGWLVDRGHLSWNTRFGDVWPEFDNNGKEGVTLLQFLRHEADLAWFNETAPPTSEVGTPGYRQAIAKMRHNNIGRPTRRLYHAVTRGLILSEITRRVDPKNRSVGEILEQEFVSKMGFSPDTDLRQTGVDLEKEPGLAKQMCLSETMPVPPILSRLLLQPTGLVPALPGPALIMIREVGDPTTPFGKSVKYGVEMGEQIGPWQQFKPNTANYRANEISSAGTFAKANVMAALAYLLTGDGKWNGKRYLSEEFRQMVLGNATRFGDDVLRFLPMGNAGLYDITNADLAVFGIEGSMSPDEHLVGWCGAGGSLLSVSRDGDWAFAFNMPSMYTMMPFTQDVLNMVGFVSRALA